MLLQFLSDSHFHADHCYESSACTQGKLTTSLTSLVLNRSSIAHYQVIIQCCHICTPNLSVSPVGPL